MSREVPVAGLGIHGPCDGCPGSAPTVQGLHDYQLTGGLCRSNGQLTCGAGQPSQWPIALRDTASLWNFYD